MEPESTIYFLTSYELVTVIFSFSLYKNTHKNTYSPLLCYLLQLTNQILSSLTRELDRERREKNFCIRPTRVEWLCIRKWMRSTEYLSQDRGFIRVEWWTWHWFQGKVCCEFIWGEKKRNSFKNFSSSRFINYFLT